MLRRNAYDWPVITAHELREARIRAGYSSQLALAQALGVSERTVTNWEADGGHVSSRSEGKVRELLWPAPGPLSSYSNYELLSELGRRLDRASSEPQDFPKDGQMGASVPEPSAEGDTNIRRKGPRAGWGPVA